MSTPNHLSSLYPLSTAGKVSKITVMVIGDKGSQGIYLAYVFEVTCRDHIKLLCFYCEDLFSLNISGVHKGFSSPNMFCFVN